MNRSEHTYDQLKVEYRMACDGDGFGDCMMWLFPIATELAIRGDGPPESWEYRAGAGGSHHEPDDYAASIIVDYPTDVLEQFGNVLSRYQDKCHAAGISY